MWKLGHRGASGYAPENSLIAFQKALELGADGIELDVHCSQDGEVMVIHDPTVDRTTNRTGAVHELTSAELQELGIPTLAQVIDLLENQYILNIEIKTATALNPTLNLLERLVAAGKITLDRFILSSFDWTVLEQIANSELSILIGVLYEDLERDPLQFAQNIRAFSLHPDYKLLTFESVKMIQNKGFKVVPWTVNEHDAIAMLQSWGVDGILSDFPDRL
ncbi:MAG: hypothetical protein RLZZ500_823 [Bacteroidota bacterium]|jgi:glycerophosphoryl diester phosphodiesterase